MITLEMQTPFSPDVHTHRLPNSFRHKCRQGQYGTGSGDATYSGVESSNKGPGDEEQRFRAAGDSHRIRMMCVLRAFPKP